MSYCIALTVNDQVSRLHALVCQYEMACTYLYAGNGYGRVTYVLVLQGR